ncbi:hypothetical protein R1flu_001466 [Riccia fluitans]|uniref:40S ribosomal protein S12 n=1 Tax=Riccia fluitans TaxID=41844 RepID=A0ABD1Y3C5_9MARC
MSMVDKRKHVLFLIKEYSRSTYLLNDALTFTVDMADGEEVAGDVLAEAPAAVAPTVGEPMDILTGLQLVLKKSLAHDGLARGLHESAKAIEKHAAQLCVLAEDCNQPDYTKLVQALCSEHNVNLISVPSAKKLGEWSGLCKIDSEGKARKVVGCSCVVVKDYGEETEGAQPEDVSESLNCFEARNFAINEPTVFSTSL